MSLNIIKSFRKITVTFRYIELRLMKLQNSFVVIFEIIPYCVNIIDLICVTMLRERVQVMIILLHHQIKHVHTLMFERRIIHDIF